jgi:hypothetical protein
MNENLKPIPPGSVIKLLKAVDAPLWNEKIGKKCRVGFYSPEDGLNVIWIVDQYGNYVETTDMEDLYDWFELVDTPKTLADYYGERANPLLPLLDKGSDWQWTI